MSKSLSVGIGGSATNDAGMGMLQALGFSFLDKEGNEVVFRRRRIEGCRAHRYLEALSVCVSVTFTIACDVDNPMYE